jgi:hypothetical protein
MQCCFKAGLGITPTLCIGESQDTVESGVSVQHKQKPNTQKGRQHVAIKAQVDKAY